MGDINAGPCFTIAVHDKELWKEGSGGEKLTLVPLEDMMEYMCLTLHWNVQRV
jgi:hypothetical protein